MKKQTFYTNLLQTLGQYPFDDAQEAIESLKKQISEKQNLRDRKNFEAHLTSKTFIFNPDFSKVLLLKHKTLGKWLQAGGHTDPEDMSILEGARREGVEETGIQDLVYIPFDKANPNLPIDIDIHPIPNNNSKN